MPYKPYHVGGGGNCVFFSTASQISQDTHAKIRAKITEMYESGPEGKAKVEACAREMLTKQFREGTLNTMLNYELHDYNFKGRNPAVNTTKLIDKLTKTRGSELNDALTLRMLAQLTTPDVQMLGRQDGKNVSIYSPITADFAKGIYNALESAAPEKKLPDAIFAVVEQNDGTFESRIFKKDEQGRVNGFGKVSDKKEDRKRPPTNDEITTFLNDNGVDRRRVIGLRGEKNHCKAFVDDSLTVNDETVVAVKSESRSSIRAIAGVIAGIFAAIKSLVSPGESIIQQGAKQVVMAQENKTKAKDGEGDTLADFMNFEDDLEKDVEKNIDKDMDLDLDELEKKESEKGITEAEPVKSEPEPEKKEVKPEQLGRQSQSQTVEFNKTQDSPTPKPRERRNSI